MSDAFDLTRFVEAQAGAYASALAELQAGTKRSHWIWFVFPQLRGLGSSAMARRYGLTGLDEARAYLAHPLLGPRLLTCTQAVLQHSQRSLREIFGSPDDLKYRSSMTLFAAAAGEEPSLFRQALAVHCGGEADGRTLALLKP